MQILIGHERGILSVSWCCEDADLLLSCGKDNRALCWNLQTSEIIGEVPSFYFKLINIVSNIIITTNSRQLGVPSFLVSKEARAARKRIEVKRTKACTTRVDASEVSESM